MKIKDSSLSILTSFAEADGDELILAKHALLNEIRIVSDEIKEWIQDTYFDDVVLSIMEDSLHIYEAVVTIFAQELMNKLSDAGVCNND